MTPVDAILARLLELHPKKIDLSLDRIWRMLERLGHPERRVPPVIHVAGTNGKGSVIAFMRRDPGGIGPQRPRLHVAASGALQRAIPHRRAGRRAARDRRPSSPPRWRNASARTTTRRSPCSKWRPRPPSCCLRGIRPTCCCSRSASAAGSTPPTWSSGRSPPSSRRSRSITSTFSAAASRGSRARRPASSGAACRRWWRRSRATRCASSNAKPRGPRAPLKIAGEDWTATEERGRLVYQDDDGLLDLPAPRLFGRHQFDNAGVAIAALRAVPG